MTATHNEHETKRPLITHPDVRVRAPLVNCRVYVDDISEACSYVGPLRSLEILVRDFNQSNLKPAGPICTCVSPCNHHIISRIINVLETKDVENLLITHSKDEHGNRVFSSHNIRSVVSSSTHNPELAELADEVLSDSKDSFTPVVESLLLAIMTHAPKTLKGVSIDELTDLSGLAFLETLLSRQQYLHKKALESDDPISSSIPSSSRICTIAPRRLSFEEEDGGDANVKNLQKEQEQLLAKTSAAMSAEHDGNDIICLWSAGLLSLPAHEWCISRSLHIGELHITEPKIAVRISNLLADLRKFGITISIGTLLIQCAACSLERSLLVRALRTFDSEIRPRPEWIREPVTLISSPAVASSFDKNSKSSAVGFEPSRSSMLLENYPPPADISASLGATGTPLPTSAPFDADPIGRDKVSIKHHQKRKKVRTQDGDEGDADGDFDVCMDGDDEGDFTGGGDDTWSPLGPRKTSSHLLGDVNNLLPSERNHAASSHAGSGLSSIAAEGCGIRHLVLILVDERARQLAHLISDGNDKSGICGVSNSRLAALHAYNCCYSEDGSQQEPRVVRRRAAGDAVVVSGDSSPTCSHAYLSGVANCTFITPPPLKLQGLVSFTIVLETANSAVSASIPLLHAPTLSRLSVVPGPRLATFLENLTRTGEQSGGRKSESSSLGLNFEFHHLNAQLHKTRELARTFLSVRRRRASPLGGGDAATESLMHALRPLLESSPVNFKFLCFESSPQGSKALREFAHLFGELAEESEEKKMDKSVYSVDMSRSSSENNALRRKHAVACVASRLSGQFAPLATKAERTVSGTRAEVLRRLRVRIFMTALAKATIEEAMTPANVRSLRIFRAPCLDKTLTLGMIEATRKLVDSSSNVDVNNASSSAVFSSNSPSPVGVSTPAEGDSLRFENLTHCFFDEVGCVDLFDCVSSRKGVSGLGTALLQSFQKQGVPIAANFSGETANSADQPTANEELTPTRDFPSSTRDVAPLSRSVQQVRKAALLKRSSRESNCELANQGDLGERPQSIGADGRPLLIPAAMVQNKFDEGDMEVDQNLMSSGNSVTSNSGLLTAVSLISLPLAQRWASSCPKLRRLLLVCERSSGFPFSAAGSVYLEELIRRASTIAPLPLISDPPVCNLPFYNPSNVQSSATFAPPVSCSGVHDGETAATPSTAQAKRRRRVSALTTGRSQAVSSSMTSVNVSGSMTSTACLRMCMILSPVCRFFQSGRFSHSLMPVPKHLGLKFSKKKHKDEQFSLSFSENFKKLLWNRVFGSLEPGDENLTHSKLVATKYIEKSTWEGRDRLDLNKLAVKLKGVSGGGLQRTFVQAMDYRMQQAELSLGLVSARELIPLSPAGSGSQRRNGVRRNTRGSFALRDALDHFTDVDESVTAVASVLSVLTPIASTPSFLTPRVLIIFDWDDTLLPTSALEKLDNSNTLTDVQLENHRIKMEELSHSIIRTLESAKKIGEIVIISNGTTEWLLESLREYFPIELSECLDRLNVRMISAQEHVSFKVPAPDEDDENFNEKLLKACVRWKAKTFADVVGIHSMAHLSRLPAIESAHSLITVTPNQRDVTTGKNGIAISTPVQEKKNSSDNIDASISSPANVLRQKLMHSASNKHSNTCKTPVLLTAGKSAEDTNNATPTLSSFESFSTAAKRELAMQLWFAETRAPTVVLSVGDAEYERQAVFGIGRSRSRRVSLAAGQNSKESSNVNSTPAPADNVRLDSTPIMGMGTPSRSVRRSSCRDATSAGRATEAREIPQDIADKLTVASSAYTSLRQGTSKRSTGPAKDRYSSIREQAIQAAVNLPIAPVSVRLPSCPSVEDLVSLHQTLARSFDKLVREALVRHSALMQQAEMENNASEQTSEDLNSSNCDGKNKEDTSNNSNTKPYIYAPLDVCLVPLRVGRGSRNTRSSHR